MIPSPISILTENFDRLPQRDRKFASDLLQKARHGHCSDKQAYWIAELAARATRPAPEPVKVADDLSPVLELFRRAGERLQRPAIVLDTPEAGAIRLTVAGERSRAPGAIDVTTTGSFETRTWLGRIHPDGRWEPSRRAGEKASQLATPLARFAANPAGEATAHGRKTGACCFCNRSLTDKVSVALGYGPVCAGNWGLSREPGALEEEQEAMVLIRVVGPNGEALPD